MATGGRTSVGMCDREIRFELDAWLANEFAYDTTTVICHELVIPRPSARIDVAVVNGLLAGYEIKSDLDTLLRLPRQVLSFSLVFERATLVTTATHAVKARALIPSWWGILVFDQTKGFLRIKRGRLNRGINGECAMHLLTRSELIEIAKKHSCPVKRDMRKAVLAKIVSETVKMPLVMHSVRETLKSRLNPITREYPQQAAGT
jgi:hypothetical protein